MTPDPVASSFSTLVDRLRRLFDDELIPRMLTGEIIVDIDKPRSAFPGDLVAPVSIKFRGSSIVQSGERCDRFAEALSQAFEFSLPALGTVDLSQQKRRAHDTIVINFFTDKPDNEFLARIREANAKRSRVEGVQR